MITAVPLVSGCRKSPGVSRGSSLSYSLFGGSILAQALEWLPSPVPFLKWAGGKRRVLPHLKSLVPSRFRRYWEPFLGGGALFFAMSGEMTSGAYLSDVNLDLILSYRAVRDRPSALMGLLSEHVSLHSKEYYLRVRELSPIDDLEAAARLIYLNKTCFNGLYRVNRVGRFNVPVGSYPFPRVFTRENILSASSALGPVSLSVQDFSDVSPGPEDLVYADPPYHGAFSKYSASGFSQDDPGPSS